MRRRDLLGEDQADSAAFGLGGVEGHKEVGWVDQARTVVADMERGLGRGCGPTDDYERSGGRSFFCVERCFGGVAEEVDEELLELVGVGQEMNGWAGLQVDGDARFELDDVVEECAEGEPL